VAITRLQPNTPYYFRLIATSASGTNYGATHQLWTPRT
jgi:hypothetical protein